MSKYQFKSIKNESKKECFGVPFDSFENMTAILSKVPCALWIYCMLNGTQTKEWHLNSAELAKICNVSQSTIWKALGELRAQGYLRVNDLEGTIDYDKSYFHRDPVPDNGLRNEKKRQTVYKHYQPTKYEDNTYGLLSRLDFYEFLQNGSVPDGYLKLYVYLSIKIVAGAEISFEMKDILNALHISKNTFLRAIDLLKDRGYLQEIKNKNHSFLFNTLPISKLDGDF